jgi:diaminohydroxyphosphoribosylaminopyrimidine deaminase/5-amino-6-(5-phosphoribosylamino)uracil reductase
MSGNGASEASSANEVWQWLRALAAFRSPSGRRETLVHVRAPASEAASAGSGDHPEAVLLADAAGPVVTRRPLAHAAQQLFELYAPLCHPAPRHQEPCHQEPCHQEPCHCPPARARFVVAHLGQSLDGRISSASGAPEAITGPEDMTHNHRMRALFDVVLVGAGTVSSDNPQLTVRHVEGTNPVRVVLDPERRLGSHYGLFNDDLAPTLLLCRAGRCTPGESHGRAEVLGVPGEYGPQSVLQLLAQRGLARVFIEGGGVTVSRFLAAGCLDRLQIAVSPMIMGRGRPGIDLAETLRLRPRVRRFELADDVLFECSFDD